MVLFESPPTVTSFISIGKIIIFSSFSSNRKDRSFRRDILVKGWGGGTGFFFKLLLFCGQNEGNDEPVETQDLSENQDEDHAHKEPGLLCRASHTSVAYDANGEAGCQSAEAHTQPGAQIQETPGHAEKQRSISIMELTGNCSLNHFRSLEQLHCN